MIWNEITRIKIDPDWYNVLNWNKLFFIYILDFLVYVKSIQKYSKPHNDTIHKCSEVKLKGRKKYRSGQLSFFCRYFKLPTLAFSWHISLKVAFQGSDGNRLNFWSRSTPLIRISTFAYTCVTLLYTYQRYVSYIDVNILSTYVSIWSFLQSFHLQLIYLNIFLWLL